MRKHNIIKKPPFIKKTFFVLLLMLLGLGGSSLPTKYVSMNYQSCLVRLTFIDLNHCYLFMFSLYRHNEDCDIDEDPFVRMFVPKETEDVNFKVFNMLKLIYESKTLAKHISCECRCESDGRNYNSKQN